MLMAVEKEKKKNPQLDPLWLQMSNSWNHWYKLLNTARNAAAAKRDKGEVLFTVFVPDRNALQERIRTPNRVITIYHWRRGYPETTHYEIHGEPSIEVLDGISRKFYPPSDHFNRFMREAA